ncbi:hypothetical protein D6200_14930 [Tenacibaculum mesophilum]|uniref:Toxin 44 n=2 Tax=Tenacibaculum mesophilum TaxID=104268 RepID=A0ABM7CJ53_9FLAO|nr:hypothetical protein D6200_14930 [Tenacibaculum mesophilum]
MSAAMGGDYFSGFAAGAVGSVVASGAQAALKSASNFWKAAGTIGAGSLSGGVGSVISGGKFWDGFRNGAISSSLNHVAHTIQKKITDPLKKHKNKVKHTLKEWMKRYKDKSWLSIATEAGWKQGQPLGPIGEWRYILNPIDGNVMDMRHVVVVGYGYGESIGNLVEHVQNIHSSTRGSAYDPQDYYSNKIGAYFYQLRGVGTWSSNSWAYDFKRFIDTQYKVLFKNYKP